MSFSGRSRNGTYGPSVGPGRLPRRHHSRRSRKWKVDGQRGADVPVRSCVTPDKKKIKDMETNQPPSERPFEQPFIRQIVTDFSPEDALAATAVARPDVAPPQARRRLPPWSLRSQAHFVEPSDGRSNMGNRMQDRRRRPRRRPHRANGQFICTIVPFISICTIVSNLTNWGKRSRTGGEAH